MTITPVQWAVLTLGTHYYLWVHEAIISYAAKYKPIKHTTGYSHSLISDRRAYVCACPESYMCICVCRWMTITALYTHIRSNMATCVRIDVYMQTLVICTCCLPCQRPSRRESSTTHTRSSTHRSVCRMGVCTHLCVLHTYANFCLIKLVL